MSYYFIIILIIIVFYKKKPNFFKEHSLIISLVLAIIIGGPPLYYQKMQTSFEEKQADETQKIKDENKQIAVDSLIEELKQNKDWVYQFINDCEKGSHLGKNGPYYSWVWNSPKSNAYEKHLGIACGEDKDLSIKITNLYSSLESCGEIVDNVHGLLNNSSKVNDSETATKVIKNNENIENICSKIQNSFNEPIEKLQSMIKNNNSNKTLADLKFSNSGTGFYDTGFSRSDIIFIDGQQQNAQ